MKRSVLKGKDRGTADYGWLKAKYSFSFANYYNPQHVNFGALRVLNDDIIEKGMGFGTHPHDNMEIITIPLEGSLKHRDSMSKEWIPLHTGEVQVMSAGTGIEHSEMNNSKIEEVYLFQIWIIPNKENIQPRYNQQKFEESERKNKLQLLVSSNNDKNLNTLKIHQDALISRIDLSEDSNFKYALKSDLYGVFVMVISGEINIDNETLIKRDSIEISKTKDFEVYSITNSELLFIEIPMKF